MVELILIAVSSIAAVSSMAALYVFTMSKKHEQIIKHIDWIKAEFSAFESRSDRKHERLINEINNFFEEIRRFHSSLNEFMYAIDHNTIDLDKRLIVLETITQEMRNPVQSSIVSVEPRVVQRRARRARK